MTTEQFDIFISHNSRDKQLIDPIVQRLYDEYEIRSWLDKWDLHAATEREPAIRQALESCRICAVVLGANGWGPHHLREARFALEKRASDPEYRVIPVLLPGADQAEMAVMGDFFQRTHRVDFSNGAGDEEAFRRLLSAVCGEAPGPPPLTVFSINRAARQWEQAALVDRPSILYRGRVTRRAGHRRHPRGDAEQRGSEVPQRERRRRTAQHPGREEPDAQDHRRPGRRPHNRSGNSRLRLREAVGGSKTGRPRRGGVALRS